MKKRKYEYTLPGSFKDAYHDCKLVDDSITSPESFQKCDKGLILAHMDEILEALKKQVPKKPIKPDVKKGQKYYRCKCGCPAVTAIGFMYCSHCGQLLDWSAEPLQ